MKTVDGRYNFSLKNDKDPSRVEKTKMTSLTDTLEMTAGRAIFVLMVFTLLTSSSFSLTAETKQQTFPSAEAAVTALEAALKSHNPAMFRAIFGPEASQFTSSGDQAADEVAQKEFREHFAEKHLLKAEGVDRVILYIGNDEWPFAIPIDKTEDGWRFNTEEGAIELLARRIGRNELSSIQVCLAYVDAQREYASVDREGDGLMEYAQRLISAPGTKNGLYWETSAGDEQSPLGPLVAEAQESGYLADKKPGQNQDDGQPAPYHGYYYKILRAQGKNAPGGAYDYMVRDRMIGGFALVAYPAQYESSGIMTFVTSHDGVVYQKDLGEDTTTLARDMTLFNPDDTWEVVKVEGTGAE